MALPPPSASVPADNNASTSGPLPRTEESNPFPGFRFPDLRPPEYQPPTVSSALPQTAGDGLRFRGLPTQGTTRERNMQDILRVSPSMHLPTLADFNEYDNLRRQVESTEFSLDHSFVPSHETLYQLRSRTEQLLQRLAPSPGHNLHVSVRALLDRIMALYRRVDRLSSNHGGVPATAAGPLPSPPQIFLATGPDGRQSLIMPSSPSAAMFPLSAPAPQFGNLRTAPITTHNVVHHGAPANQNPVAVQDIVRQAVVNQQRRREVENVPAGQYLRRIWLFIRLYFCIYMISSSGTWARVFLVAAAVLIALLSDTEIPRQLHGMLVAPIQRHLEGLAHGGGPAGRAAQAAGDQSAAANQAGGNAANTVQGELWSSIRRMERAIVLLLASLIPGIGERQVEARNAAEAEAERLRQEEQQRLQEQQQQEQAQAERGPDAVANDTVGNDTAVNSGATEPPQPEPAVPA